MLLLTLLLVSASLGSSLKFLVYSPQHFFNSVNFLSKSSDALIDEGHEVVMVSPRTHTLVGSPRTKARVLEVPQAPESAELQAMMNSQAGELSSIWNGADVFTQIAGNYPMYASWVHQCKVVLEDRELIELLREEHFDAAYVDPNDPCGYVLFHILGIEKYATVYTLASYDGYFRISQVPFNTAYEPSTSAGSGGDKMTFYERLRNTLAYLFMNNCFEVQADLYQSMIDRMIDNPPNLRDLMQDSSLVFMNSDPLNDFPKMTSSRVIDIGGITVHAGHSDLDQYWSSLLNLRNRTIFISFGTFVTSHLMPAEYKETIRATAGKFPNVTFIWKYEKPEHNISRGIENMVETTWAPQNDLLHDPRLTAFITHGGQGSITESAAAGIPLICIPVTIDQFRNCLMVERNGVGIMLDKDNLGRIGPIVDAIGQLLKYDSYKSNATTLAQMISERPFRMKDIFVRNMEFLAKFGPLHRFSHYGAQLSFVQYYLIDVFGIIALVAVSTCLVAVYSLKHVIAHLLGFFISRKTKCE